MASIDHALGCLRLVATALVVAGTGCFARAQDDHEPDENAEAVLPEVARLVEGNAQRQALIQQRAEQQLQRQRDKLKEILDNLLLSRLDELKRSCRLSEAQVRKLTVAGRIDINRLFDRGDDDTPIKRPVGPDPDAKHRQPEE
jgi:hypothetical protein